jgi:putative ABC transport system substrate-binding protein
MMDRRAFLAGTGAVLLAAPRAAEAQPAGKVHRIGVLGVPAPPPPGTPRLPAFHERLRELGYVEGRDYSVEYRSAEGNYDRLAGLAAELVRARVDVIYVGGNNAAKVVRDVAGGIPVVSVSCDGFMLVASLARPGGNLTGVTCMRIELTGKRLEILKETVPSAHRIALLYNPIEGPEALQLAQAAARQLNVDLVPVPVVSVKEFEAALDAVRQARPDALFVNPDAILFSRRQQIAAFVRTHRLPAIEPFSEFVDAGGLMSYGASNRDLLQRAAELVDKILKGAKPGDIPVEQATRFYLAINMNAAKALGVTIPPSILLRADKVVE